MIATPNPSLRLLADLLTPDMIDEIAEADYGNDFEKHRAQIVAIAESATTPTELRWHPAEVLELMRWSEPEDPHWKPGRTGRRGHIMRAFCCAALLHSGHSEANRASSLGYSDTAIQLLDSLDHINAAAKPEAANLLSALGATLDHDMPGHPDSLLLFAGAIWLALQAEMPEPGMTEPWLDAFERCAARRAVDNGWLDLVNHGLRSDKWKLLLEKLDALPLERLAPKPMPRIKDLAMRLYDSL
jgi:hypothetical protein